MVVQPALDARDVIADGPRRVERRVGDDRPDRRVVADGFDVLLIPRAREVVSAVQLRVVVGDVEQDAQLLGRIKRRLDFIAFGQIRFHVRPESVTGVIGETTGPGDPAAKAVENHAFEVSFDKSVLPRHLDADRSIPERVRDPVRELVVEVVEFQNHAVFEEKAAQPEIVAPALLIGQRPVENVVVGAARADRVCGRIGEGIEPLRDFEHGAIVGVGDR